MKNKTKQNKKRVFFIRYSFLSSISFFLSSTGDRTGRNLTFPYFLNVTETSSFMFPLHLRFVVSNTRRSVDYFFYSLFCYAS